VLIIISAFLLSRTRQQKQPPGHSHFTQRPTSLTFSLACCTFKAENALQRASVVQVLLCVLINSTGQANVVDSEKNSAIPRALQRRNKWPNCLLHTGYSLYVLIPTYLPKCYFYITFPYLFICCLFLIPIYCLKYSFCVLL
jgi:hypothetical protein